MTRANLPVLMVVTIAEERSRNAYRVVAEYIVKVTVPMKEPDGYAEYAISRIAYLDRQARDEGDQPLIPDGCTTYTMPLEFEGNVYQMWTRQ